MVKPIDAYHLKKRLYEHPTNLIKVTTVIKMIEEEDEIVPKEPSGVSLSLRQEDVHSCVYDRDELLEFLNKDLQSRFGKSADFRKGYTASINQISKAPAKDVVVYATWIHGENGYECSNCGCEHSFTYKFCHECGRKMKG